MPGRYVPRNLEKKVREHLRHFPAVVILGPRQCGKSTLARKIISKIKRTIILDLEKPSERARLTEPELYFSREEAKLVCLDEIQRMPEIFPVLRSVIDEQNRNGQFLILGSASRDLIRQTSESLAGRISYLELPPFQLSEVKPPGKNLLNLWLRGGFPRSYLAKNNRISFAWLHNFIRTFLERDIPQLGFGIPADIIRRLWSMCAHSHGQLLNTSQLGKSLGVSHTTVRSYIHILSQTFMLRVLSPFASNMKKRLVKSPKIYLRDSGILHALLEICSMSNLNGHPVCGSSWEGFAMENIIMLNPDWKPYFYRTAAGAELDLVLVKGERKQGFEFKLSSAPQVTKGFYQSVSDIKTEKNWIIAPVKNTYPLTCNTEVISLEEYIKRNKKHHGKECRAHSYTKKGHIRNA